MQIDQNTVAVITGAGSGIGRALALGLAARRAGLAIADVNREGLAETAHLLAGTGVKVSTHIVDVADQEQVAALAGDVVREHGHASLLINNAGVALIGNFEEIGVDDMEWLMSINFWGVVYGVRHFLPILRAQPRAHIVNISSIFGIVGFPGQTAYCASKFAVRGLSESLRHELEAEGANVQVSVVHPGGIKTNIARAARPGAQTDLSKHGIVGDFDKLAPTTPEQAAEQIIRGILRNKPRIVVGPDAGMMDRLQRLLPVRYFSVIKKQVERQLGRK
ncbi:MAG: SDR family NAD(P)-dependent oxidoreductase [Blastocatellia bacterium]